MSASTKRALRATLVMESANLSRSLENFHHAESSATGNTTAMGYSRSVNAFLIAMRNLEHLITDKKKKRRRVYKLDIHWIGYPGRSEAKQG